MSASAVICPFVSRRIKKRSLSDLKSIRKISVGLGIMVRKNGHSRGEGGYTRSTQSQLHLCSTPVNISYDGSLSRRTSASAEVDHRKWQTISRDVRDKSRVFRPRNTLGFSPAVNKDVLLRTSFGAARTTQDVGF